MPPFTRILVKRAALGAYRRDYPLWILSRKGCNFCRLAPRTCGKNRSLHTGGVHKTDDQTEVADVFVRLAVRIDEIQFFGFTGLAAAGISAVGNRRVESGHHKSSHERKSSGSHAGHRIMVSFQRPQPPARAARHLHGTPLGRATECAALSGVLVCTKILLYLLEDSHRPFCEFLRHLDTNSS